jgi:hypothetical protein
VGEKISIVFFIILILFISVFSLCSISLQSILVGGDRLRLRHKVRDGICTSGKRERERVASDMTIRV